MSETLTQIANQALIEIKKDTIKSLDTVPSNPNASSPNQKSAAVINVVLPEVLRWVQIKSRWSDLLTEVDLTLVSAPDGENLTTYQYLYPTDVLGYVQLFSGAPYEVRSKYLYTQDPTARLRYIRHSTVPSEWNPFLTRAIVTELAARIAPKLNVDASEAKEMRNLADSTLIDSSTSDYTNRASPREKDAWFELNQSRAGIGGRYPGSGRIARLRNETTPRYPLS